MNATDFISEGEYKALKAHADKEESIRFGREIKGEKGAKYSVTICSSRYVGTGEYFMFYHYSRKFRCESLTGGWSIDGGTFDIDFSSYESVKEEINRVFRHCPDCYASEQISLF